MGAYNVISPSPPAPIASRLPPEVLRSGEPAQTATYLFLCLLTFTVLFTSCSPEPLVIEIDQVERQVVVFSQIIPDQVMTVFLTSTFGALDFSEEEGDTLDNALLNQILVGGAEVTVSYRNVIDTLFEVGEGAGFYVSLETPQFTNEEYNLKIITADGHDVSATSVMLPQIFFTNVTPVVQETETDTLVTVEFDLIDLPEDNRYMINYFVPGNGGGGGNGNPFGQGAASRRKTILLDDAAFTDHRFEGTTELPDIARTDTLVVTLSNISEPYYRFLQAQQAADNFLALLTREPISAPSNIRGGLGFFNTHFPDARVFDLNDY